ncbi:hypothetical protein [Pseudomonas sp. NPDC086251]|uniref:hypothetical protein n=1 Tax=Pseudomonas sp. NPDC086251 TaxID=3364431 RepID=UPI0038389D5D
MTFAQEVIAAMFKITNDERYGFYVAYEPVLIERIIELTELPFNGESVAKVKAKLLVLTTPLKGIGVEVVRNGDFISVFGPGVLKHV